MDALPHALVKALREHNAVHSVEARIRLRMSLHAGEVTYDQHAADWATMCRRASSAEFVIPL